jgi:hypothetical protein
MDHDEEHRPQQRTRKGSIANWKESNRKADMESGNPQATGMKEVS